jgi:uncharacterized membrane protein YkvA (DUF1232 family)
MLSRLRARAQRLLREVDALVVAARDPRTPWYARILALGVVAYALSPIDLIPDFIPVVGYLDDLLIVPAGLALALWLIPDEALEAARSVVAERQRARATSWGGALLVMFAWALALGVAVVLFVSLVR